MVLVFTDQNFEEQVIKAKTAVLVDFFADWCNPCKMMAPTVTQLAEEYDGELTVGKLNVDESQKTAAKFNVMSIPTLIIFKAGQPVKQIVGLQDKISLQKQIDEALAS
ncbi:MAG: thioredoxin [Patescibacteria group bacterium]